MTIKEAIDNSLTETTKVDPYVAKIIINGKKTSTLPVDVRILKVSSPLSKNDVKFIYNEFTKDDHVYFGDAKCFKYFIGGDTFKVADRILKFTAYGPFKIYNGIYHIELYCTNDDDSVNDVEIIPSEVIKNKVINELNVIIQSNDIVKKLLPSYNNNWIHFSDDDIAAIESYNAMQVMKYINIIDDSERGNVLEDVLSSIDANYASLPESVVSRLHEYAKNILRDKIYVGFECCGDLYNPRYVIQWLLYIIDNNLLPISELCGNKLIFSNNMNGITKIKITKNELTSTHRLDFTTPDECIYNFTLILHDAKILTNIGYLKYTINSVGLYYIDKDSNISHSIAEVSTNQTDNLEVCTQIIDIISGSNAESETIVDYYENIIPLLKSISTATPEEADSE